MVVSRPRVFLPEPRQLDQEMRLDHVRLDDIGHACRNYASQLLDDRRIKSKAFFNDVHRYARITSRCNKSIHCRIAVSSDSIKGHNRNFDLRNSGPAELGRTQQPAEV